MRCDKAQELPSPSCSSSETGLNHFLVKQVQMTVHCPFLLCLSWQSALSLWGLPVPRWLVLFLSLLFSFPIGEGAPDMSCNWGFSLFTPPLSIDTHTHTHTHTYYHFNCRFHWWLSDVFPIGHSLLFWFEIQGIGEAGISSISEVAGLTQRLHQK